MLRSFAACHWCIAATMFLADHCWAQTREGPLHAFKDSSLSTAHGLVPTSKEITIRMFFDATSSMRGYVGTGAAGLPQEIQRLEQAALLSWAEVKEIQCFKFGTEITRVPGSPCYSIVGRPGFFGLPKNQDYTKIEAVLATVPDKTLTIIVTDLFEDEGNLGQLFQYFKSSVFNRRLAVGIVAMRAGFNGTIYDIGLEKGLRKWTGSRPFYALVIGQGGDIEAYFSELTSRLPAKQLLIFSDALLEKPVSWDTTSRARTAGVAVDPGFINVEPNSGSFGVLRMQNSDKCELALKLDTQPARFHPAVDWTRLAVRREIKRFPRGAGGPEGVTIEDESVSSNLSSDRSSVTLSLTWLPKRIKPGSRVYVERISLPVRVEDVDFSEFPFIHEWSINPVAGTAATFDGGKTQYLSEFILGLWKSFIQVERPNLGSIYVYFQT